jgi:transcriptional regulator of arginine metabolism
VTLAGANLVVVRTVVGGASRVGLVIDRQEWAEVVGTVAGDDTLFIAVTGAKERDRLRRRLQALVV